MYLQGSTNRETHPRGRRHKLQSADSPTALLYGVTRREHTDVEPELRKSRMLVAMLLVKSTESENATTQVSVRCGAAEQRERARAIRGDVSVERGRQRVVERVVVVEQLEVMHAL